jgi:hypothetical protein
MFEKSGDRAGVYDIPWLNRARSGARNGHSSSAIASARYTLLLPEPLNFIIPYT